MPVDLHKNFAFSTVVTAPSPATSGTSLVVAAGQGALFPAVPFNATICPALTRPTAANAEIVRVTARSTDTLTIVRAQEGTTARTVLVGDEIAATVTAKTLTDVETLPVGGVLAGSLPNPTLASGLTVPSPVITGRMLGAVTAQVPSANNLTLGMDGNRFTLTGSTQVTLIDATGWSANSEIVLLVSTGPITLKYNQTASGAFKTLVLKGAVDCVIPASGNVVLFYGGASWWYEQSRSF